MARCLDSLMSQNVESEQFEVLVVDNNSSDGTPELVERYIRLGVGFRYVLEPVQGLSQARNRGASAARAPYLTYIDDDARAPCVFVRCLFGIIDTHQPDIIGGPIYP
jgi:glycosyltransferase involved in cell wall biosynthesis